jgi:hypothetical protein
MGFLYGLRQKQAPHLPARAATNLLLRPVGTTAWHGASKALPVSTALILGPIESR